MSDYPPPISAAPWLAWADFMQPSLHRLYLRLRKRTPEGLLEMPLTLSLWQEATMLITFPGPYLHF